MPVGCVTIFLCNFAEAKPCAMQNKIDNYALFRRGADDGFLLGLYFTALFFAIVYSMTVPLLSMTALLMMAGVPVVTYVFLRRSYVADYGTTRFSALWMQGIVMFFCGSLILALVSFVFMQWIVPDYIVSTMRSVIELYSGSDLQQGREAAELLQTAMDSGMVPKPIQVSMELLWSGVFTGSILSIVVALIVQARKVTPHRS